MSRFAAWRAALRIARRDAWRNKGRSALVAIMIALPVLAVSFADVVYRSEQRDPRDVVTFALGDEAQATVSTAGSGDGRALLQTVEGDNWQEVETTAEAGTALTPTQIAQRAEQVVSPRNALVQDSEVWGTRTIRLGDKALDAGVREIDYAQPGLGGLVEQLSGRSPRGDDEVVATETFARSSGVKAGDTLTYTSRRGAEPRTLTVVGIVGGIPVLGMEQIIGQPGTLLPEETNAWNMPSTRFLVAGPDRVTWDQVLELNQLGLVSTSRTVLLDPPPADRVPDLGADYDLTGQDDAATVIGIAIVTVGLILLQVALLAGPAIAVGARRNQRGLAIVAAGGGERRHLRSIVLATSGVVGAVASLAAAAVGAGIGTVAVVVARERFGQQFARVDIAVLDLLGLVLVGTVTAVAASLIPARQAARLDLVAALTGRRGQTAPRLGVPLLGLLVAVAGAGIAFWGASRHQALLTVIGIALGEIGLVAATGALVALAARLARRFPLSLRFALRDAARQRGRTAPAVAAVMAATAGCTAALLYIAAQTDADERSYQPSSAMGVVTATVDQADPPADGALEAELRRTLPIDRVATLYQPVVEPDGTGTWVEPQLTPEFACPLFVEGTPTPEEERILRDDPRCNGQATPRMTGEILGGSAFGGTGFDDGSALALVTGVDDAATAAALSSGKAVVFDRSYLWPDGTIHVQLQTSGPDGLGKVRKATLPAVLSTMDPHPPGAVLPLTAAKKLKLEIMDAGLVAGTTRLPTGDEEARAVAAAEDIGGYVSVERGYVDNYALGLLALVAAAIVVALGGTFTAVGLAAAEGRADIATLAAVGASPGVRRRIAAGQAAVIAGMGAGFGVLSGVLAGWALVRLRQPVGLTSAPGFQPFEEATWQFTLPWPYLAAIALGVPLLAVMVGFATTRSRLPMVRRLGQ